ncbi:hypothetical protein HHI36_011053 [Cryptolaemus montrouzieri]|uniref:Uncharacterized protein n=1 Tax=Cryptolaemus montrouzieri TaxID=559131 RepID=A0ABD2MKL5_9CUCU
MANPGSSNAPLFDEDVNLMKSMQSKRADIKDEYSLYGEQIAIKLRSLPPQTRFYVQKSFNQILFDAEIGQLEVRSVVCRNSQCLSVPCLGNRPRHSPGYFLSSSSFQSQSPLNSSMSFVPALWQSPTAPVNYNPTELSPGYSQSSSTSQSQSPASFLTDLDNYP